MKYRKWLVASSALLLSASLMPLSAWAAAPYTASQLNFAQSFSTSGQPTAPSSTVTTPSSTPTTNTWWSSSPTNSATSAEQISKELFSWHYSATPAGGTSTATGGGSQGSSQTSGTSGGQGNTAASSNGIGSSGNTPPSSGSSSSTTPASGAGAGSNNSVPSSGSGKLALPAPATSLSAQEQQLFNLTNQFREANGLAPYKLNLELTAIERMRVANLVATNEFTHDTPAYGTAFQMESNMGITAWGLGAENLVEAGSIAQAFAMLEGSPGHRANLLNSFETNMGVAVIQTAHGIVAGQLFLDPQN